MEWRKEYSVGNEQFDADHKFIFELLNKFRTMSRAAASNDLVMSTIDELIAYTRRHFDREEQFMKSIRYPGLVDHIDGHDDMIIALNTMKDENGDGHIVITDEVADFIEDWWRRHILQHDMAYKQYAPDGAV